MILTSTFSFKSFKFTLPHKRAATKVREKKERHIASTVLGHVITFTKDRKAGGKQHNGASLSHRRRLCEIRSERTTERHFGLATWLRAAARSGHESLATGCSGSSKGT